MQDITPRNALILARISDARDGDEHGVTGQVANARKLARRIDWKVGPTATHVIIENDTSAFKRRKIAVPGHDRPLLRTVRPEFRRALDMLWDGRADGVIAIDLDRVARDPRDLEDLIDVVEARTPRLPVESLTGSLRLANDADITMARVMVAVGNKASRDTKRRVEDSQRARAADGKYRGTGKRPFGYESDGVTVAPVEAAEIVSAAEAIIAGVSLRSLTASLQNREVPTVTGAAWSTGTLRDILLRARNAGLAVYRGEVVGKAEWSAIMPEETWRAVVAVLTDPARRTSPGNAPQHLGSLIYLCGTCNNGATVAISGGRQSRSYVCRDGSHLRRIAKPIDDLVRDVLCARLAKKDAVELLMAPQAGRPDTAALRAEAASLGELLNEQARLHARKVITTAQLEAGSGELQGRLRAIEAEIEAASVIDPLAGIAGRPDALEVWEDMPLERQRGIVRTLLTVTILPRQTQGRLPGGGYVDMSAIDIDWKRRGRVS